MAWDKARGVLTPGSVVSTLPAGFRGDTTTAEIAVHPNGRFVYASNRGHDSIAVFAVEQKGAALRLIQHQSTKGRTPRNFILTRDGRWLLAANQASNNITVFSLDSRTGRLAETPRETAAHAPVCLLLI